MLMSTYRRLAPFGVLVALALAAACSSSGAGSGGGKPDSGSETGSGEDASADTGGGGDTGSPQDASEGGSTSDSPVEATSGDGGPCTPSSLGSSLVLWLEGDMGLTSTGSPATVTWTDQSTAGNDATSGSAQANPPTIDSAVVNGHTALKFDGTNSLVVKDAASLQWGTDSFAVLLVMSSTTQTADAGAGTGFAIFSKLAPGISGSIGLALQLVPGGFGASDYQTHQITANTTTIGDGNFHVVGMVRSGGLMQVRLDGASLMSGSFPTNISANGQPVALGQSPNLAQAAFAGDIAEVVAVHNASTDLTCLEGYLKTKYGL
jgi:hypothetical protein